MKTLILLLCLIPSICFADLSIIIENKSKETVLTYIDSIDHDLKIDGVKWPYNVPVCGAEMKSGSIYQLGTRKHNKAPYRYKLTVLKRHEGRWNICAIKIFKIAPDIKKYLVLVTDKMIGKEK